MLNMASEIHSSPRADSPITESSLMSVVCQPSAIAVASVGTKTKTEQVVIVYCGVGRWKRGDRQTATSLFKH
jgi:hypothetical protein